MCVKEFLGYSCGHCSIAYLRLCPIAASNPYFPPCRFAAERPVFTNGFCHPCGRVLWNKQILKEEEEHRGRHERGECRCEVIFGNEDRDRRRPGSGNGQSGGPGGEPGPSNPRAEWNPDAQMAAYHYVRYTGADPSQADPSHTGPSYAGPSQGEAFAQAPAQDPFADMAAVAQGRGFPTNGFIPAQSFWAGQSMLGQPGAGMKWYPEAPAGPAGPEWPVLPPLPTSHPPRRPRNDGFRPPAWQRPASEPVGKNEYLETPSPSPMVVNSSMARASSEGATSDVGYESQSAVSATANKPLS